MTTNHKQGNKQRNSRDTSQGSYQYTQPYKRPSKQPYKQPYKQPDDPLYELSKSLSSLLRHDAIKKGLCITDSGHIACDTILSLEQFSQFTFADIEHVVANNNKKRFALKNQDGKWYIKANQGHTGEIAEIIKLEKIHTEITEPIDVIFYGATLDDYKKLYSDGLKVTTRWNIEFNLPKSPRILIYVNMELAMADGIKFYMTDNGIIVSKGIGPDQMISIKYFTAVIDQLTKRDLLNL